MVPKPASPAAGVVEIRANASGFTLLEMLAAMAVLALLVVFVAQVFSIVTSSVTRSEKKSVAETEARGLFSRMGADLRQAALRRDLDFSAFKHDGFSVPAEFGGANFSADLQPGNDRLAFYAQISGWTPSTMTGAKRSSFAVVGYSLGQDNGAPRLFRSAQGLAWEAEPGVAAMAYLPVTLDSAFPNLFTDPALSLTAAEDVFRFEVSYLLRSRPAGANPFAITPWSSSLPAGKRWPDGLSDVAAIVVTVAVLDARSRNLAGDMTAVAALFPDAKDAEDPAAVWREIVGRTDFATRSGLPPEAASAVRIYQHTFSLPQP